MAFLDLAEGILESFGEAQNFVTIDTVAEFRRANSRRKDGSDVTFSIHDPRKGHRTYHMMQRVRGRCCACNGPSRTARCQACSAKRRHRERVKRAGENYAERKCECGCGETLALHQQRFISSTHKARHWWRMKQAIKPVVEKPCDCGCGEKVTGRKRFVNDTHKSRFWSRQKPKNA